MKFHRKFWMLLFILIFSFSAKAQDTIRVMQYNLMFYGMYTDFCTSANNNVSDKDQYLETILGYFKPDIFIANEMGRGASNITQLLNNALNVNGVDYYDHGTYTNSSNGWFANALYYDSRKFGLLHEAVPNSTLRDINLYKLYYKADDLHLTGDTTFLTVIAAHLKAGQDASDQQTRTTMISNVMNYLGSNNYSGNIIFAGDFNMRSSFEQAYQIMVAHANPFIRLNDPVDMNGVWGNNPDMALYHTQSPRTGSHDCFVTGGMDDRYDFILTSMPVLEGTHGLHYVDDSYVTIGQDGNRYNQSLLNPANYSQPEEVLSALYNMSDHLPVMLKMITTDPTSVTDPFAASDAELFVTSPFREKLRIDLKSTSAGVAEISLYSVSGAKNYTVSRSILQGINSIVEDIPSLGKGVFVLRVILPNDHVITRKIIKL